MWEYAFIICQTIQLGKEKTKEKNELIGEYFF